MAYDLRLSARVLESTKVRRLMRRFGAEGFVSVLRIWAFACEERQDGDLSRLTSEDIADIARWEGDPDAFVGALRELRFLDGEPNALVIHNWVERQPWLASQAKRTAKAKAAARARWTRAKEGQTSQECYEHAPSMHGACDAHAQRNAPSEAKRSEAKPSGEMHTNRESYKAHEPGSENGTNDAQARRPSSQGTNVPPERTATQQVVDHYRSVHPKRGRHLRPGHADWKRIEARLRETFTPDDLCAAIDGNLACSWHAERRAHSVAMVFRNASKVETFIEVAKRGNPQPKSRGWLGGTMKILQQEGGNDEAEDLRLDDVGASSLLPAARGRPGVGSDSAQVPPAALAIRPADDAACDEPSVESVPEWVSERWRPRRALPAGRA